MMAVLVRDREREDTEKQGSRPCQDGDRDLSDAATSLGMPGAAEAGTGKEAFSLTAFRGRWPCQHFDFRISGRQNCDSIDSCCFKPL